MRRHLFPLKLGLTGGVVALIWWSLSNPDQGILRELSLAGPVGTAVIVLAFLAAVFFYCRDLYRLLAAVPAADRTATPKSVWLMFLIPYNFVEDFFIIGNIASSLRATATRFPELAPRLGRFGLISGLGWCSLQILSLIPHDVGSLAGFVALPLWLWHWRFVRRARAALTPFAAADQEQNHAVEPSGPTR